MRGEVVLTLNATESDQCRAFKVKCPYVYVGRGQHRDVIVAQVPTNPGGRLDLPGGHDVEVDGTGLAIKVTDANDSGSVQDLDFLRTCARFKDERARRAFPLALCYLPNEEVRGSPDVTTKKSLWRSILVTQAMGNGTNLGDYVAKLAEDGGETDPSHTGGCFRHGLRCLPSIDSARRTRLLSDGRAREEHCGAKCGEIRPSAS